MVFPGAEGPPNPIFDGAYHVRVGLPANIICNPGAAACHEAVA
jgi:hypothetical protein